MSKKHKKSIRSNAQQSKKKQRARFDCVYNRNNICQNNISIYMLKHCVGNKLCSRYKYLYDNNVKIDFLLINNNIQIRISIYNNDISDFIKTTRSYEFIFRGVDKHGVAVLVNINFYTLESFIRFILNENDFEFNIKRTSKAIIMSIDHIKEIPDILDQPYNKLAEKLRLSQKFCTQNFRIHIRIIISKQRLFEYIEKLCESQKITQREIKLTNDLQEKTVENANTITNDTNNSDITYEKQVGVTAIVLSDNRKCVFNSHAIEDVQAILRLATKNGNVINYSIPAAFCQECDAYFVLKKDFEKAKQNGVILCPVIDKTIYINRKKYHSQNTGGESRIHEMGYNVQKENDYTNEQRQTILANILENTNISKHEIQSNIDRCVRQHQKQPSYADAIKCWINDYQFLSSYKHGDVPQVIIEKIKIGR